MGITRYAETKMQAGGQDFLLKYYVDEVPASVPVFGLRVEKYADGKLLESQCTPALFDCRAEAEQLASRFAQGSVTPLTLVETVDEIL